MITRSKQMATIEAEGELHIKLEKADPTLLTTKIGRHLSINQVNFGD